MKIFSRRKFSRMMFFSLMLLFSAGAGLYYSVLTLTRSSIPRPSFEGMHAASLALLSVLSLVILLALGVVVFAATALLGKEKQMRRRAETGLARFRSAADASPDIITILTPRGRIEYVNDAVELATGFLKEDLINRRFLRLPWHDDKGLLRKMLEAVMSGNDFTGRTNGKTKSGSHLILEERATPFRDKTGAVIRLISTARDLTRELRLEDRVEYLSRFDELTGLPNRDRLVELLGQTVAAATKAGAFVSVLIFDMDRFKQVNDLCGVEAGDEALKEAVRRIRSSVAAEDIVARTGTDEFTVVHVDAEKPVLAGAVAQRVREAFLPPMTAGGQDIVLTMSAGIAVHPDDGGDAWTLLQNADLALERAKAQGRNAVQFFDPEITRRVQEFFVLEKRLFSALANREYFLHYQPYCDLRSRKVTGAEALIRWKNPDLGVVSPARFIPSLEDTGKVIEVGRWILETACGQCKEWERQNRHFPVSVNLSLAQFRHEQLVGMVRDTIKDCRIDPGRLTLEVTETIFMHDTEFAIRTMKQLKDVGVALSVDDFGTGYSSLSYIKKLPVDNLKIDISFVRDVTTDQDAASIISAITTLAQNLKLKTIAEGVETEEQRNILHLLRCDMGQGFLFGHAVDAREFDVLHA